MFAGDVAGGGGVQRNQSAVEPVKASGFEGFGLQDAQVVLLGLEEEFPDWFREHDAVLFDPVLAEIDEIRAALATAPSAFLQGCLWQTLLFRQLLASITGRG